MHQLRQTGKEGLKYCMPGTRHQDQGQLWGTGMPTSVPDPTFPQNKMLVPTLSFWCFSPGQAMLQLKELQARGPAGRSLIWAEGGA